MKNPDTKAMTLKRVRAKVIEANGKLNSCLNRVLTLGLPPEVFAKRELALTRARWNYTDALKQWKRLSDHEYKQKGTR